MQITNSGGVEYRGKNRTSIQDNMKVPQQAGRVVVVQRRETKTVHTVQTRGRSLAVK